MKLGNTQMQNNIKMNMNKFLTNMNLWENNDHQGPFSIKSTE